MKNLVTNDLLFLLLTFIIFTCSHATNINSLKGTSLKQRLNNAPSNDELGGTLLSLVAPSPAGSPSTSTLFNRQTPTTNLSPPSPAPNPAPAPTTTSPSPTDSLDALASKVAAAKNSELKRQEDKAAEEAANKAIASSSTSTTPTPATTTSPASGSPTSSSSPTQSPSTTSTTTSSSPSAATTSPSTTTATSSSTSPSAATSSTPAPVPAPKPAPAPEVKKVSSATMKSRTTTSTPKGRTTSTAGTTSSSGSSVTTDEPISRTISIIAIIILGFILVIISLIFTFFRKYNNNDLFNFFVKCIKLLATHSLIYFLLATLLLALYGFGSLSTIDIDWKVLIASIFLFALVWVLFSVAVIAMSILVVHKWNVLEKDCPSFKNLEDMANKLSNDVTLTDKEKQVKEEAIYENYEYAILKQYFTTPFFPQFKSSNLRKDFNFGLYLTYSLIEKLGMFFNFSWTCLFFSIFFIVLWNVIIAPASIVAITAIMMILPALGILMSIGLFYYMKAVVYRNVVAEVDFFPGSTMKDIEPYNQSEAMLQFKRFFPIYLQQENISVIAKEGNTFTHHFHNRPPNFYETTVMFGITGFTFLLNLIQTLAIVFIIWGILLFAKHLTPIMDYYGGNKAILALIIPMTIIYLILMVLITTLNLRWFTVISSIEMNRNEECIRKTINHQKMKSGEMAETVFKSFKKIFYDIKLKKYIDDGGSIKSAPFEFALTDPEMMRTIELQFDKFKEFTGKSKDEFEEEKIQIKDELRYFLKSTGNRLDDSQIDFMLHLIIELDKEHGELSKVQIAEIWGALIKFSSYTPQEILYEVLTYYYTASNGVSEPEEVWSTDLNVGNIEDMIVWFEGYFTTEQKIYILNECSYIGTKKFPSSQSRKFSKEAFVYSILGERRFYPY